MDTICSRVNGKFETFLFCLFYQNLKGKFVFLQKPIIYKKSIGSWVDECMEKCTKSQDAKRSKCQNSKMIIHHHLPKASEKSALSTNSFWYFSASSKAHFSRIASSKNIGILKMWNILLIIIFDLHAREWAQDLLNA
jgi:hypothetical protein